MRAVISRVRALVQGTFIRFLIGGVSTTLVSYAAYLLLLSRMTYLVSYAVAYAIGIIWSYFANTLFVFRSQPSVGRALAFPLVYLVQFVVGSTLLVVLIDYLKISAKAGPLVVVILTLPLTYLMSRWLITANVTHFLSAAASAVMQPLREVHRGLDRHCARLADRLPKWLDTFVAAGIATAVAIYIYLPTPIDLHIPLFARFDAISAQYLFKSVLDHGTYLQNPDVGAPFGATMYDYPIPEPTHHLLIRLIGLFTADPFLAMNVFYLFSFATAAFTACWALELLKIGRLHSIAGAVAFSLLPYHFYRIAHVFLASYAAIPVIGYYAIQLSMYRAAHVNGMPRARWTSLLALAIAAGTGVYYAFFGALFIAVASAIGYARSRRTQPLFVGAAYAAAIVAVVVLSQLPNALYHLSEGANPLVAHRSSVDAEFYGLRLTHLLFPPRGHRLDALAAFTASYNLTVPGSENTSAALGLIGSIGFVIALVAFFSGDSRRYSALWAAGALCVAGVLYATIGGFGVIVAQWVPEIRALNRISVYIGFFSIFAFLTAAKSLVRVGRGPSISLATATIMIVVAYADQIPIHGLGSREVGAFETKKAFFTRMEATLPRGTSVYELPYICFPECVNPTGSYALLEPYLFTDGLRWSFGEMHGRPGDQWNEEVSNLHGSDFAGALARAGFGAIYVDRLGYTDKAVIVEKELRAQFGAPIIEDASLARAVYRVGPASSDSAPLTIANLGRGWFPWERGNEGDEAAWSKGDSDLVVANPNGETMPFVARFKLISLVPRKVTLSYGSQVLAAVQLKPGEPADMTATINAEAGVSRLSLTTDVAAQRPGNGDARRLAFRIMNLNYAATTHQTPPSH